MKPYKLKTSHPVLLGCALIMLCAPEAVAYEQKVQGGTSNDCFTSVCVTKDKGFAIAGWTESNGAGGKDAWVQKYDKNQTLQWERYYGGTGDEEIAQLVEDVDGSLLFCGYTTSKGNGGKDAWVVKLAKNGKLKWDKTVGGALDDEAITLSVKKEDMVTQHGYFIAINTLSRGKGGLDVQTCFFSEKGDLLRELLYGTTGDDRAYVSQIGRYGFEVAGCSLLPDSIHNWVLNMNSEYESMDKFKRLPYPYQMQTASFDGLFVGEWNQEEEGLSTDFTFLSGLEPNAREMWYFSSGKQYLKMTEVLHTNSLEPYLVTGSIQYKNGEKALLASINSKGYYSGIFRPIENEKSLKNGYKSIQRLSNGLYVVAGYYQANNATQTDAWWCLLSDNDFLFHQSYGLNGEGLNLSRLKDGSLVVLGTYSNNFTELFKLDEAGRLLWSRRSDALLFEGSKAVGLLILENETIVVCLNDSLLGYRQDGSRVFACPRRNADACPILLENNRFTDVRSSGFEVYDEHGKVISHTAFEPLQLYNFKLNSVARLRDGSLVLLGFQQNERSIHSVDGFSFYNDYPCAACFDTMGKLRWKYHDDKALGQFSFLMEQADGTLALHGRGLTMDNFSSTQLHILDAAGHPTKKMGCLGHSGFPKQVMMLNDTTYLIVGQDKGLTLSYPNSKLHRNIPCPVGAAINDIVILPDSTFVVTGEMGAHHPLSKRMMVCRLNKNFQPVRF